jgi:hypothetical protein
MALFGNASGSWQAAVAHLTGRYKYEKLSDTGYKLLFGLPGGRDQIVLVQRTGNDKAGDWIEIASPVGDLSALSASLPALLRECDEKLCGSLVATGEVVFLRHTLPAVSFQPATFDWALQAITATADTFEERYAGGNKY